MVEARPGFLARGRFLDRQFPPLAAHSPRNVVAQRPEVAHTATYVLLNAGAIPPGQQRKTRIRTMPARLVEASIASLAQLPGLRLPGDVRST